MSKPAATPAKKSYDSNNIKTLVFPESIRQKPTLYIGPIDERGILTIIREVMDNVVDEALAGRASKCEVFVRDDEEGKLRGFYVLDDGEGIPVGPMVIQNADNTKTKIPAIKAILSMLHTSGKFDDSAYTASRGTHGIGVKATNALSTVYEVWTFRDGKWWNIRYEKGVLKKDLAKSMAPKHPVTGKSLTRGTLVYLQPDANIFTVMKERTLKSIFSPKAPTTHAMLEWMRLASYFTPGLTLKISHSQAGEREFVSENGPKDFIARKMSVLNKEREEDDKIKLISEDAEFQFANPLVDVVVAFSTYEASALDSFTNGLRNAEGGVHVDAFLSALKTALAPFSKGKKGSYTIRELREGLVALVNVKLSAPQFDSQTKEKLVDERAGAPVQEFLTAELTKFFNSHKKLAIALVERATNLSQLRSKFMASKKVVAALRNVAKKGLSPKATVANGCKPEARELFLIEGDSAAGTARNARDHRYQETLPLKGKVMNAARAIDEKVLVSEEIVNILAQLGFDPKAEDPYEKLRVGKIIQLADPDPDGPLAGDTKVDVKYNGEWLTVTMAELATPEWNERKYEVISWNGDAFCLAESAGCAMVINATKVARITLNDGSKLIASSKHQFALSPNVRYDDRVVETLPSGLRMIHAQDLKCGDRLASTDTDKAIQNRVGRPWLGQMQVSKVKHQEVEPMPMYCMTVPKHHNFLLHNGLVSKNCHINSLLLTLLYKFLPKLFDLGMVYVADVPEFYAIAKGGVPYFGHTKEQLATKLADAKVRADIQHIKGYGEVDAKILRILAFDPATRALSRIVPTASADGEVEFFKLMGGSSEARKKLLGV